MNQGEKFFESEDEEENYFVSMTDMMVGMLFIFVLMLMYYALQVRIVVDGATSTRETQIRIINDIVSEVREGGVEVEEDAENGIIRLKNNVLFASGNANVSKRGEVALGVLASAILKHTKCHTYLVPPTGSVTIENTIPIVNQSSCVGRRHEIEAIFVEGHTDNVPIRTERMRDNWDLSTARATNTYRSMIVSEQKLSWLRNGPAEKRTSQSVMSVAGYAAERPIVPNSNAEQKALNRRIDIRLIMKPPDTSELTGTRREDLTRAIGAEIPDSR